MDPKAETPVYIVVRENMDCDGRSSGVTVMTVHRTREGAEAMRRLMEGNNMPRKDGRKYFQIVEETLKD